MQTTDVASPPFPFLTSTPLLTAIYNGTLGGGDTPLTGDLIMQSMVGDLDAFALHVDGLQLLVTSGVGGQALLGLLPGRAIENVVPLLNTVVAKQLGGWGWGVG
jgi:hypothetical protein